MTRIIVEATDYFFFTFGRWIVGGFVGRFVRLHQFKFEIVGNVFEGHIGAIEVTP